MSNYDEIKTTIFKYFNGLCNVNREMLEEAFAVSSAHMKGYLQDESGKFILSVRPMNEVIDEWVAREPAPHMTGKIIAINIYSDIAATALFDFNGVFTDAFQLAKIDGQWKIINKFYTNK
jgi:hypothetical protein